MKTDHRETAFVLAADGGPRVLLDGSYIELTSRQRITTAELLRLWALGLCSAGTYTVAEDAEHAHELDVHICSETLVFSQAIDH